MDVLKVESMLCLFACLFFVGGNVIQNSLSENNRTKLQQDEKYFENISNKISRISYEENSKSYLKENELHSQGRQAIQVCSSDSQCETANEYCDTEEGLCSCKPGFYRDKNTLQCLAYKECSADSHCGEEEYCSSFGVCDCRPKYFKRNLTSGMCEEADICLDDDECNEFSEFCDDENVCDCRNGFHRDINSNKCKAYKYCNSTNDCGENEYCNSQDVCDCVDGSYRDNETKQCTTYTTCFSNQHCGDNQYCNSDGLCVCKTGFYRDHKTFECVAYKICSRSSRCWGNQYCNSNGVCVCEPGYFRDKDTKECIEYKRCTEGCGANEYCDSQNPLLYGNCLCKSGYYKHRDTRECVAYKKCSSHDQCNVNEFCNSNSVCDCKSGFHREEDTWKCIAYKQCNITDDCIYYRFSQFCNSEGACDCKIGYHWERSLKYAHTCTYDKHRCATGYYMDKDTLNCLAYKYCLRNEDCNPDEHCISGGVCDCNEGYYRHKDTLQCLPLGVCSDDSQCNQGQRCNGKGLCECKRGFKLDRNTMKCNVDPFRESLTEMFSWPTISPTIPTIEYRPTTFFIVSVSIGVITVVGIMIAVVYSITRLKVRNQQECDRFQGLS